MAQQELHREILEVTHPQETTVRLEFAGEHPRPDFLNVEDLSPEYEGLVTVQATVASVRRHGKVAFLTLEGNDPTALLQTVIATPAGEERDTFTGLGLRRGTVVHVEGALRNREAQYIIAEDVAVNPLAAKEIEAAAAGIRVIAQPEIPLSEIRWQDVARSGELRQATYGEVIRLPEFKRMYRMRRGVETVFTNHFTGQGFQQIDVPALTKSISESGAEVFRVRGKVGELALIQSPQQIKQVLAGLFGRVVWNGQAFRDDPSFTAHHLAEFTGLDVEMQITQNDKREAMFGIMAHLTDVTAAMIAEMRRHPQALADNGAVLPVIPERGIPVISFEQAMRISQAESFNREAERRVGEFIRETTGSDFYFVEGFPADEKPFYTDINEDRTRSYSFDLVFRGVEIASGGLRIANGALLRERLEYMKYNPADFEAYLDHFDRGTPQTGGFGIGLERLIAGTLGTNVRLTTLNPKTARMALG